MDIWQIIWVITALGAIGGIVNSAIVGEFQLPKIDKNTNVWRPGWIGSVLVGGVTSVVVWGVYGPLATYDVIANQYQDIHLTVSQLLSSIIVGLGGGRILTQIAQAQADQVTKNSLASAIAQQSSLSNVSPNL